MTLRFQGYKSPELREHVETKGTVRLNARGGMGGGLNAQEFTFRAFTKTTPAYAAQMHEPFEVETLEGLHTGKAGDWLAIGPHGEMYPIDREVFEASYVLAEG